MTLRLSKRVNHLNMITLGILQSRIDDRIFSFQRKPEREFSACSIVRITGSIDVPRQRRERLDQ